MEENDVWYRKMWFFWVMLFACPPAALILALTDDKISGKKKALLSVIAFGITLSYLLLAAGTIGQKTADVASVRVVDSEESKEDTIDYRVAVIKAKEVADTYSYSKKEVYEYLLDSIDGHFDTDAAKYGVDNADVNWKMNALITAKEKQGYSLYDTDQELYDSLTGTSGDQFTPEEAQYAIDNLK